MSTFHPSPMSSPILIADPCRTFPRPLHARYHSIAATSPFRHSPMCTHLRIAAPCRSRPLGIASAILALASLASAEPTERIARIEATLAAQLFADGEPIHSTLA